MLTFGGAISCIRYVLPTRTSMRQLSTSTVLLGWSRRQITDAIAAEEELMAVERSGVKLTERRPASGDRSDR